MQGKFLTKNIELIAVCAGSHCDHWEPMNIQKAMFEAKKSCTTGELLCEECGCVMKLEEEFIIKD